MGLGVPYSYGYAILALTLLVKVVTFPLTKKQVEGSIQMQAIQPRVKELQAMYANDPERLQMETARLYKEANFNPLAGCLPTFATLPVFIGLYRALSNAAVEGVLTDGFYWIPSLGGPTSIEARNDGNGFAWLFPFVDGAPPLGWHDTIAYLILPAPRSDDSSSNVTRLLLPLDGGGGIIVASSLPPKENEIFLFRLLGLFAVSLSSSSSFPFVFLLVGVSSRALFFFFAFAALRSARPPPPLVIKSRPLLPCEAPSCMRRERFRPCPGSRS